MFQFELLQQPLPVRNEGRKITQEGHWMLQPRFVEHNGKREDLINAN